MKEKTQFQLITKIKQLRCAGLLVILFVLLTSNSFGQSITWQRTYLQSNFTSGYCIKQTSDGNYITCGSRFNSGGFIAKLNSFGDTLWIKYYPVSEMYSIVEANDGNYVAIGISTPLFIVKVTPNGNTVWMQSIPEAGYDIYPYHINKTNDNCFVVAGKAETGFPSTGSGYFIKIDNNGNKIWSKIYGPESGRKSFVHVKQLSDNNYILTGGINPVNTSQIYLVKTNTFGDTLWTKSYGDTNIYENGNSVYQLWDNGFIIIGISNTQYPRKLFTLRTDSIGNLIWYNTYGEMNSNYGLFLGDGSVKIEYNNTYIITGYKLNYPAIDTLRAFLLNVDSLGNKIWEKTFFSDTIEARGWSVDVCSDSGFVISGQAYPKVVTERTGSPSLLYVIKTNKLGETNPIGINPNFNQLPINFRIYPSYPNPFNPITNIKYDIPESSIVTIKIYNSLGQNLKTLVNKLHLPGSYSVTFDGSNYPSGIYFIDFTNNLNYKKSIRCILIK